MEQVKVGYEDVNKCTGTAKYNRNLDYSKTFLHNPVVVRAKESIEVDAHEKARQMQEEIESRRQRKAEVGEQH